MYYLIASILKLILFLVFTQSQDNVLITLLSSILIVLGLLMIVYRNKTVWTDRLSFVGYCVFSVILLGDVLYYLYFHRLLSVTLGNQLNQLPGIMNVISFLLNFKVLLLVVDLPILLYFFYKQGSFYTRPLSFKTIRHKLLFIGIFLITIIYTNYETLRANEFFTYHMTDIIRSLKLFDKDEYILRRSSYDTLIKRQQNIEGPLTSSAYGKNVLWIQVEALQSFVINRTYQGKEITPNLNRLIRESGSLYFNNYFQNVARGNTADAEFVGYNSLLALKDEILFEEYSDNTYYSLAHLLKEKGYKTYYFHGNEANFYNREKMSKQLGFDRSYFLDDYKFKADEDFISYGINDFDFLDQTFNFLSYHTKDQKPWMASIITMSSHIPFDIPEHLKTWNIENPDDLLVLKYFEAVHYADQALGYFLEKMKTSGLMDNTMLVLYGDHMGLNYYNDEIRDTFLQIYKTPYEIEQMVKVPLIINIPGYSENKLVQKTGSHLDLYPTVIDLLGYENKKGVMLGQDLLNSKAYNNVMFLNYLPEGTFIDGVYLYLASRDQLPENYTVMKRTTLEEVNYSQLELLIKRNQQLYQLSEVIIKSNGLKPYIK